MPQTKVASLPEALLDAYIAEGVEGLRPVRGEFAYVLWDKAQQSILFARDANGAVPLFLYADDTSVYFADTIQSLFQRGLPLKLNERRIAQWLNLSPTDRGVTFFDRVESITPGSIVQWSHGKLSECSAWRPDRVAIVRLNDSREYHEGLRQVLVESIRDRLPLDGPAVCTLSGGLDSTTVTALAADELAQSGRSVLAYTAVPEYPIVNGNIMMDERDHAGALAGMYPNVRHELIRGFPASIFETLDAFSTVQGEPCINLCNYGWFAQIGRLTHGAGISRFLVAIGGNLTISLHGNNAVKAYIQEREWRRAATLASRFLLTREARVRNILRQIAEPLAPPWLVNTMFRMAHRSPWQPSDSLLRGDYAVRYDEDRAQIEARQNRMPYRQRLLQKLRLSDPGPLAFAMQAITGATFTDPTADPRVVEYCWGLPVESFAQGGIPRSLIRSAMRGRIPEVVLAERRRGRQSSDFGLQLNREKAEALAELARMRGVEIARRALDLDRLDSILHWSPQEIAANGGEDRYWFGMMRALALGRFLRRLQDGTLFS